MNREQLQIEIAELEQKEDIIVSKIKNAERNTAEYSELVHELNKVRAAKKAKEEALKLEGVAEIAQAEVFSQFENITVGDGEDSVTLSMRGLCKDENAYQLVSEWIQRYVGDQAQSHQAVINSYQSQVDSLEEQLRELATLRAENMRLADKAADLEAKRDAAADEIQELQDEVNRLKEDNTALRKQLESKPNRTSNVDLVELAKKMKAEEEAAKPGIYNIRWKDGNRKTHYLAELSKNGETIEIPYLEKGKYREETAEAAARFREELAKKEMELMAQEDADLTPFPPALPTEDAGVPQHTADREMDAETITRAEFEGLQERVRRLEQKYNRVA